MRAEIITVSCIAIIAIVLFCCVVAIFVYEKDNKKHLINSSNKGDWLFLNFHETVFNIVYKNPKSDTLCGINKTEYERYCKLLHVNSELKKLIAYRIEAVFISILLLMIAYISSYSIMTVILCFLSMISVVFMLWVMPYSKIKTKAEERLYRIEDDLPRFLALLEKAMDLPIDQAMMVTASRFDSPLSDDIMESINKVALGANGWTETLIELAKVYNIEDFSDLILEIVNSYEQGLNVRSLIVRKAKEVEQSRLYNVEAHDSRIKTLIFLPIIVFKVIPLMILICLPMIKDFI